MCIERHLFERKKKSIINESNNNSVINIELSKHRSKTKSNKQIMIIMAVASTELNKQINNNHNYNNK